MNIEQFNIKMLRIADRSKYIVMAACPVRTGNMRDSIEIILYRNGKFITGFDIIVNTKKAPYFKYTENSGPNESWFSNASDLVARYAASQFGTSTIKLS